MANHSRGTITFTSIIFTGLALAVFGAIVAALGLGGVTAFDGKLGDVQIKTSNVGLAILAVGALLAGVVALKMPKDVYVFGESTLPFGVKLASKIALPCLIIGGVSAIALFVVMIYGK